MDEDGVMVFNEQWDTRNKNHFPTLYQKADLIKKNLREVKKNYNVKSVFIEQSLHSFRSGFSSAQTLSTLSRFNGIVSWFCFEIFKIEPDMIAATSARKQAGVEIKRGDNAKQKTLEFVLDREPSFVIQYTKAGNPKPGTMDRSDSYVIARAGYLQWNLKR
ncbi:hypothetical protein N9989_00195 [bacterium]|jgi:hypothetical protein|nr:hypothetical protein [bacterium]